MGGVRLPNQGVEGWGGKIGTLRGREKMLLQTEEGAKSVKAQNEGVGMCHDGEAGER